MAITSLDALIASALQRINYSKTASITTAAGAQNTGTVWHLAGSPGAGTLAVGNTANGVVPTDATTGFPPLNAFGGLKGYVSRIEYACSVACNLILYDRLFHAGAFSFATNYALTSVPSYSGRVPGGTDYSGTELWVEQVTAGTGVQNVNVTYTNQAGTGSRTTGTVAAPAALIVGRMFQLPLQAGDSGVQAVTNVTGSVASAGTYNVVVLRRLATMRVNIANFSDVLGFDRTGLPEIFETSALCLAVAPDSTSTGIPNLNIDIRIG